MPILLSEQRRAETLVGEQRHGRKQDFLESRVIFSVCRQEARPYSGVAEERLASTRRDLLQEYDVGEVGSLQDMVDDELGASDGTTNLSFSLTLTPSLSPIFHHSYFQQSLRATKPLKFSKLKQALGCKSFIFSLTLFAPEKLLFPICFDRNEEEVGEGNSGSKESRGRKFQALLRKL